MAQGSFPWDCNAGGDGDPGAAIWDTPYSSAEWRNVWSKLFGSNRAEGMVIPGYGGNLRVHEAGAGANMTVEIETGAIFSRGGIHESDAVAALAIDASDPVLPRLDRIVARLTVASQQIRLAIVKGTAANPPTLPVLTTTAATWEVDIAHVYVVGNSLTVTDEVIDDRRIFFNNGFQAPNLMGYNLLANSEFMAFSALSIASPTTYPPDYWRLVLTPTAIASATKLGQMSRGRAVQVTTDAANEGIYQTILVKPSTTYAFRGCYQVTSGDVGKVNITTNSGAPVGLTRELRRTGTNLEFLCYYTTEADATTLTLQLLNLNAGDIVQWGQFLVAEGYEAGPFREIRETLAFEYAEIRDAAYDGDTVNIGTYALDFDTNWGGLVLVGTRSAQVFVSSREQTLTNNVVLQLRNVTTNRAFLYEWQIGGQFVNWSTATCWIAMDVNRQIEIDVSVGNWVAAWITIIGIEV